MQFDQDVQVLAGVDAVSKDFARTIGPTIELMLAYNKANSAPVLKHFVSKVNELIARVSNKRRRDT